jgi:hypothetical protein
MNLYKLHNNPKALDHYDTTHEQIPELIWEKYQDDPVELKKREKYIAKDAEYSYLYAIEVLKGPFKAGEAVIATNALFSYFYAMHVLKGPFKAGEAAIAKDAEYSHKYAQVFLKARLKLVKR